MNDKDDYEHYFVCLMWSRFGFKSLEEIAVRDKIGSFCTVVNSFFVISGVNNSEFIYLSKPTYTKLKIQIYSRKYKCSEFRHGEK